MRCTLFAATLTSAFAIFASSPALSAQPGQRAHNEGWSPLFNGKNLEGWTTAGDLGAWGVADGELYVKDPGKGWWLRTEKMYRDFELELEFLVPENGNSGVGLRGSSLGDPAFTGLEVQIFDSHGAEPSVNQCGAVYNAIAPRTMAVNPAGEWNAYRIRLVGDTLDVWLNGRRIHEGAKLDDRGYFRQPDQALPLNERLTTGYISLQDHGDAVRFRNIRIRDLSPDPEPQGLEPIFNGRDLSGWHARGGGEWLVESGGVAQGTLLGSDGPGHLFTDDDSYTDFELRTFVKVNERGNSGIYFRTVPNVGNPDSWPTGYEAQVDNHDPKNFTGCIYNMAWPEALERPITRDGAWFDYRVRVEGDRVRTWINGRPMVDAELDRFDRGHFALQTHHQGNEIRYRDLRVKRLSGAKADDQRSPAAVD